MSYPEISHKKLQKCRTAVVHTSNPSAWEAEAKNPSSKASLIYVVSSRPAKAGQRNPDSKK